MEFMTSESLCANLIERYVSTCGLRVLVGQDLAVIDARPRRLHVEFENSPSFGDVLTIQVSPACSFPVADRAWLTRFADAWNQKISEVTMIVHGCSNPKRVGVSARRTRWIREDMSFEEFASFADRTIAVAIALFADLAPVAELPSPTKPLLRNAG